MFSYIYLLFIGLVSYNHIANVNAQVTLQSNNVMPTPGNSLTLSCLIQDDVNDNTITWYRPKSDIKASTCFRQSGLCTGSTPEYSYTANQSGAYVDITSINRDQDEGTWKCTYSGSNRTETTRTLNITVYTLPSQLVYTTDVQAPTDLIVSNLSLHCKTTGCTYPPPVIKWYYKTQTSPVVSGVYSVGIDMTSEEGSCSSQEKLYTSTHQIPLYTTWSDNSDKNVTFYCGIEYPDPSRNIQSADSGTVRFAVAVTSVTLSISASEVVFYEGYPQMMTCISSPSRPVPTIRWFLGSRLLTDNITTTNTTDAHGLYILTSQIFLTLMKDTGNQQIHCKGLIGSQQAVTSMERPSVNVWYKPSKPMVREYGGANSGFPWLENMTGTLQCYSSDYGNPGADVTWLSDRGVMDSMKNLMIPGLMPSDYKRNISCKLVNKFTSDKNIYVLSDPLMLDVEYRPVINYNASNYLHLNETQSLSVLCEAVGNPNPQSVKWKNVTDDTMLRFDNISRMDNGTYTCEATARSIKYGTLTGQKQMNIIVQYAPDVKVIFNGSNQHNQAAILICEAEGFPAHYTFNGWVHMWEDMVIRNGLQGVTIANQSILTIDRLSLESMGTYVCTANNGITGINGHVNQTGSGNLTVTGMPNILDNNTLFVGEIGMSVNISIPLYSNPVIESIVIQRNGTEIINNSRIMTRLTWDLVNYTFYGSMVKLKGQKTHLIIQNLTHEDFDNYTLELRNSIGKTDFRFQLNAFGPPFMVLRFYFNRFVGNQIELHFDPGFNGGPSQTFVIEEKSGADSDGIWHNTSVTSLLETERQNQFKNRTFFVNITKPVIPGIYQYRMYSWNMKGKSEFSEIITVTVPGDVVPNQDGSQVAAIAGGIGAASVLILISAVTGTIIFMKRRPSKKADAGLVENPMYDHSGTTNPSSNAGVPEAEYAQVAKKSANVEDSSSLYAQVDKKSKTRKNEVARPKRKQEKILKGEIYENATLKEKSLNPDDLYENPEKVKTDLCGEYAYENAGAAASNRPKVSKEGLLYADVVLGAPTTKNGKPIIWGVENHTEYAEIAYGKRGDPLPDGDNEKENGN